MAAKKTAKKAKPKPEPKKNAPAKKSGAKTASAKKTADGKAPAADKDALDLRILASTPLSDKARRRGEPRSPAGGAMGMITV